MRRSVLFPALAMMLALPANSIALNVAPPLLPIGAVQGSGERSPYDGERVMVEGVITADMRDGLGGVFVQDGGDGDAATSDGLFVQLASGQAVQPGQWLRISGTVQELAAGRNGQSLTALQADKVTAAAERPAPGVTVLDGVPASWEALEGMQVRITAPLTLSAHHQLARHGELTVAFDGRLWQPSELAAAGTAEHAAREGDNARRRLRLDDGSSRRDPDTVSYLPADAVLRTGMVLEGVEGVVDQRFDGDYRLQLTAPLQLPA